MTALLKRRCLFWDRLFSTSSPSLSNNCRFPFHHVRVWTHGLALHDENGMTHRDFILHTSFFIFWNSSHTTHHSQTYVFRMEYRLWDHKSERIIKRSGNWRVRVRSIWKFSFTRVPDIETWDYLTYWSSKWGGIKIACGRNCWYSRLISLSDINSFLVKCNTFTNPWRGKLRTRDWNFRLI